MKLLPTLKISMISVIAAIAIVGCSSKLSKVDLSPTANPTEEITKLESDINQAYAHQTDVLASIEFSRAQNYLRDAKEDLADNDKNSKILENVAYGKAYLNQALTLTAARTNQATALVGARQKALDAGAKNFPPTEKRLKYLDDDFKDEAADLQSVSPDDLAEMQKGYMDLELGAIISTQLSKAQGHIEASRYHDAKKYCPNALRTAELDYENAKSQVTANRNTPEAFSAAVRRSNASAVILSAVLVATKEGSTDESSATKIVLQNREIHNLQGEIEGVSSENQQLGAIVENQNEKIVMQKSIEMAREQFSKQEAEAFQQGDKLVLRLKSIHFSSGRSELPKDSLTILAKVKKVAEKLGPQSMVIEGHTDSVGNASMNKSLSKNRADAIAKYFETNGLESSKIETVGYGYEKPLSTNKTRVGRSQNRRVDVIITPEKI